ncbi:MAG: ROK family transcriptional regulator, partial [Porcipelethomonas sp.]
IDINPNYKFALGVTISENGVSIGLSNLMPEVLDKNSMNTTDKTSYEEIVGFVISETNRMLQNSCLDSSKILGMGISVQPELCSKMKVYFKDGKLDFTNLTETFESKLNIPVICMNSISALALSNQEKILQNVSEITSSSNSAKT